MSSPGWPRGMMANRCPATSNRPTEEPSAAASRATAPLARGCCLFSCPEGSGCFMFPIRCGVLLLVSIPLLAGCGSSAPRTVDVKGKVLLDGAPMATGQVMFDAGDGTPPATVDVSGGEFAGKASTGKRTVRILSFKKMRQK